MERDLASLTDAVIEQVFSDKPIAVSDRVVIRKWLTEQLRRERAGWKSKLREATRAAENERKVTLGIHATIQRIDRMLAERLPVGCLRTESAFAETEGQTDVKAFRLEVIEKKLEGLVEWVERMQRERTECLEALGLETDEGMEFLSGAVLGRVGEAEEEVQRTASKLENAKAQVRYLKARNKEFLECRESLEKEMEELRVLQATWNSGEDHDAIEENQVKKSDRAIQVEWPKKHRCIQVSLDQPKGGSEHRTKQPVICPERSSPVIRVPEVTNVKAEAFATTSRNGHKTGRVEAGTPAGVTSPKETQRIGNEGRYEETVSYHEILELPAVPSRDRMEPAVLLRNQMQSFASRLEQAQREMGKCQRELALMEAVAMATVDDGNATNSVLGLQGVLKRPDHRHRGSHQRGNRAQRLPNPATKSMSTIHFPPVAMGLSFTQSKVFKESRPEESLPDLGTGRSLPFEIIPEKKRWYRRRDR